MRALPKETLDPKALTVWRIRGVIGSLIFALIPLIYITIAAIGFLPIPPSWVIVMILLIIILEAIFAIALIPSLRLRYWRYEVTESEIDLYRGIFVRTRTLIPMTRVQHVDTKEGPLYRYYNLAAVVISTAATQHEIPALSNETANELRDRISELALVVEDDV